MIQLIPALHVLSVNVLFHYITRVKLVVQLMAIHIDMFLDKVMEIDTEMRTKAVKMYS